MTMNSEKNPFQVKISDNSFLEIVWAKANKISDNTRYIADFSADLYVDGIPICTMNKLSIINTTSKNGESVLQLGSMFSIENKIMYDGNSRYEKEQKVFSITFFPGSKQDNQIEFERSNFVNRCVEAVTAFIENQAKIVAEKNEQRKNYKPKHNPKLDKLKEVTNNVRSMFIR